MPLHRQGSMHKIISVTEPDHIHITVDLAKKIWHDHFTPIIGQAQVDYMLDTFQSMDAIASQISSGHEYYLLSFDSTYVGYLAIHADESNDLMTISKIYIDSSERGSGHGTHLLTFVKNTCLQRKISKIRLVVNQHNETTIQWYQRKGFIIAGEAKKNIGSGFFMDDFIMEMTIT